MGSDYYSPGHSASKPEDKRQSQNTDREYVSRFSLLEAAEDRNFRSQSERKYEMVSLQSGGRNHSHPRGSEQYRKKLKYNNLKAGNQIREEKDANGSRMKDNSIIKQDITDKNIYNSERDEFRIQEKTISTREEFLPIDSVLPPEKIKQIMNQRGIVILIYETSRHHHNRR